MLHTSSVWALLCPRALYDKTIISLQPRTDHEGEQINFEDTGIEESSTSESDAHKPTVAEEDEELNCDIVLSAHDSDKDPTESDSDSESDGKGKRTHKKSMKDQIKRKTNLLKVLPYKSDIFPPRPPREWKGGRKGRGWMSGKRNSIMLLGENWMMSKECKMMF